jgi:predicted AAA+ superfamily ATPase
MYEREDEQFSFVAARTAVERALQGFYGLALFQHVLDDAAGQAFLHLLRALASEEQNAEEIAQAYSRAFRELAAAVSGESLDDLPDSWHAYLTARILQDTNPWSSQVERDGPARVAPSLRAQARRELRLLQQLFALPARLLWQLTIEAVASSLPILRDAWVPWIELTSSPQQGTHIDHPRRALAEQAARSDDWAALAEPLEHYWSRYGTGIFARYTVLRWQGASEGLRGIAYPDPVQLADLVGYEREKSLLAANIERFLADLPAHHALLYGAPGTGKSSTVKALANQYAEEGLRLVEVRKEMINDLPNLVPQLRERAPHFLVFIDDLSFEEHETAYKGLKVFLEGAVESQPTNVLIYATTNRFNLIRENFADRGKQSEDVHWRDTMDEKQSLVARFGLRVTFTTPDQERYLHIVAGIARRRGLIISEETLRTQALQWERQHVGRSGRLARQFIDTLEAEMKKSVS